MTRIDDDGIFRKDGGVSLKTNVSVKALGVFLVHVERRRVGQRLVTALADIPLYRRVEVVSRSVETHWAKGYPTPSCPYSPILLGVCSTADA